MRFRPGIALTGALSVLAIGLVAVAVATTSTVQVQFVNESGIPIINNGVAVYDNEGEVVQKLDARPLYDVIVEKGAKATFELEDPVMGPTLVEVFVPLLFVEPLEITVPDAPTPAVAPLNDLCDDAEFIVAPSVTPGTTVDATTDSGAPACPGTGITSPGVWYEFMGTGNLVTADLCNGATGYDSKLSSYCLDCAEQICASDANDDACGLQSAIDICTQPGATYRVLVHGFGGQTGPFELTLTEGGACSAAVDCTPPEPTGACCDCSAPPYNCEQTTASMCGAMGGNYFGDGVACTGAGDVPIVYISNPSAPIPDADPIGLSDTISVPDADIVGDVNVGIQIDHTWIGDLIITITHGDTVLLWDRACGSEDNMDVVMDDEGAVLVCAIPTTGSITPVSADGAPLDAFDGSSAFGDWTLTVSDNAGADLGTLQTWWIEVGSGTPTCPDQNDGTCFLCEGGGGDPDDDHVTLCHYPPGNPENHHTITVGAPAVPAHLAHGDTLGACADDGDGDEESGPIEDVGSGGGVIDLMNRDSAQPGNSSSDEEAEEDRDVRQHKVRRTTRTR